jgi:hypothetical protein
MMLLVEFHSADVTVSTDSSMTWPAPYIVENGSLFILSYGMEPVGYGLKMRKKARKEEQ